MPTLTVFTPAYNRAHTLPRTYASLQRQTCRDFSWLVVDDGSTDGTEALVAQWMASEKSFEIRYLKKENGGLHTAYNAAIANMTSELAVCIDSDDYMPDDGVEVILRCWQERGGTEYAGITGLDYDMAGNLIGGLLPEVDGISLIDLSNGTLKVKDGDKKHVVRVDLYKSVAPMPVFPGEKNFNPHYMHLKISEQYRFIPLNRCLCIVDYQPDGMTSNMFRQYLNSPNSFLTLRKLALTHGGLSRRRLIRTMIHLCSEAQLAHHWGRELGQSEHKLLMLCCTPFGTALTLLTRIKGKPKT